MRFQLASTIVTFLSFTHTHTTTAAATPSTRNNVATAPHSPPPYEPDLYRSFLRLSTAQQTSPSRDTRKSTLRLRHIFHKGGREHPGVFRRMDFERGGAGVKGVGGGAGLEGLEFQIDHDEGVVPVWNGPRAQRQGKEEEGVGEYSTTPGDAHPPLLFQTGGEVGEDAIFSQDKVVEGEGGVHAWSKRMRVPNATDPKTVLALAQMTYNAYVEPEKKEWIDIPGWNKSVQFGWQSDGIRGYVFIDDSDEVMVITVKGTSIAGIGGGSPTTPRDKFNDNIMFSCCCAAVDRTWRPICDCCSDLSTMKCSSTCLRSNSSFADSYYNLAQTIFVAIQATYPRTSIWLTGHSLGGALASLLGLTNNVPVFAYEAPGDLLYASRLGLLPDLPPPDPDNPSAPPDYSDFLETLPIYHFGNTGDPVYLGVCNGPSSSCYWGGYALESRCHAGKACVYDPDNPPSAHKVKTQEEEGTVKGGGGGLLDRVVDVDNYKKVEREGVLRGIWDGWLLPSSTSMMKGLLASTNDEAKPMMGKEDNGIHSDQHPEEPGHEPAAFSFNTHRASSKIDIRNHGIEFVIKNFLEKWEKVPVCAVQRGCRDCELWTFE
ncbi:putative lipase atg15 [Quaeritorhiza haematococci]|nr:putative lipase atg15 [Quaeritorhiza haematococci]